MKTYKIFEDISSNDEIYTKTNSKQHENLIFLDFDGVCNSFENGSYLNLENTKYGYDNDIIKRLRYICKHGNAKIVISSNWRRFPIDGTYTFTYNDKKVTCENPLPSLFHEIGDLIIGTLPKDRHINKSEALELWFEYNQDFDGKYAILEDDPREGYQYVTSFKKNLWLTDPKYGVTDKIADEIVKHFK